MKKAPIMILDEPTSALDAKSAQFVQNNLSGIVQGATVLMITHKMSMLAAMNKVYVVEGGKVVDVEVYGSLENYLRYLESHELR